MISNLYFKKNYDPIMYSDGSPSTRLKNLNGEIKILSVFEYSVNNDSTKGEQILSSSNFTYVFDKEKRIIEEWGYRDSKQIVSKTFILYSEKGKKIDSYLSFNENGEIRFGEWFEYNNDGIQLSLKTKSDNVIKEEKYDIKEVNGIKLHYNKWSVDKYIDNVLVEESHQNGIIIKYSYYPSGQLLSKETFEDGKIITIEVFNNNGYLIEIQHYEWKKSTLVEKSVTKYKYCLNNLKIEEIITEESNNKSTEFVKTYIYTQERLSEVIQNGELIVKCHYNDYGDLIEQTFLGTKEKFEYLEYDAKLNWIKRNMYINGKLYKISEREIEYF